MTNHICSIDGKEMMEKEGTSEVNLNCFNFGFFLILGGGEIWQAEVQLLGKGKQIVCFCRGEGGYWLWIQTAIFKDLFL